MGCLIATANAEILDEGISIYMYMVVCLVNCDPYALAIYWPFVTASFVLATSPWIE